VGVNILGSRKVRKLSADIGMTVLHAWVRSNYLSGRFVRFTTDDHRHGWFDRDTGEIDLDDPGEQVCASSCRTLFPNEEAP
jgi:hypothetical protein